MPFRVFIRIRLHNLICHKRAIATILTESREPDAAQIQPKELWDVSSLQRPFIGRAHCRLVRACGIARKHQGRERQFRPHRLSNLPAARGRRGDLAL